jgi:predicted metal-binding protein
MSTTEEFINMAKEIGFSNACALDPSILEFRQEVREMCAADKCNNYNKSWMCPPACGTLEEAAERASKYHRGIIVQVTKKLEDDFDVDGMMEAAQKQKEYFYILTEKVREEYPNCLPMSTGACQICKECSYPDNPCRFPEKAMPSMEAYGLVVSDVCTKSNIPYYYGPQTLTYSGCILID